MTSPAHDGPLTSADAPRPASSDSVGLPDEGGAEGTAADADAVTAASAADCREAAGSPAGPDAEEDASFAVPGAHGDAPLAAADAGRPAGASADDEGAVAAHGSVPAVSGGVPAVSGGAPAVPSRSVPAVPAGSAASPGADTDGPLAEQLLRFTRRVHRIQKRHIEQSGLGVTPAQSRLLRTLAHYGSPPRMADLAARLEVVPRAVTSLVDGLEASGKVRRVPDPANRRVIRIELTVDGRETLRALRETRRRAAAEILAPLTAEQRQVLGGLLDTLVGAAGEEHEGGGTPRAS